MKIQILTPLASVSILLLVMLVLTPAAKAEMQPACIVNIFFNHNQVSHFKDQTSFLNNTVGKCPEDSIVSLVVDSDYVTPGYVAAFVCDFDKQIIVDHFQESANTIFHPPETKQIEGATVTTLRPQRFERLTCALSRRWPY